MADRIHQSVSFNAAAALVILLLLTAFPQTQGAQFYVAPNGTASNNGSIDRPWDLQTALNQSSQVAPGSTIWLRGGIYRGTFVSRLQGTQTAPIIVRNYQHERVTLDNPSDCDTLNATSSYTHYWGLELTSSGTKRKLVSWSSYCGGELDRGIAFRNFGPGNKLINMIIHDNQQGVGSWGNHDSFPHFEIYGSLIYYNAAEQTAPGRQGWGVGHAMYVLSYSNGSTRIIDNISVVNANTGIRCEGPCHAPIIEGNISAANGDQFANGGRNLYVNGLEGGLVVRQNYTYYGPARVTSGGAGTIGGSESANPLTWSSGTPTGAMADNYFAGPFPASGLTIGVPLALGYFNQFAGICTGNTIVGALGAYSPLPKCAASVNTYSTAKPGQVSIFVRPNQYEPGRAHVAIYNWPLFQTVSVSLATTGLQPGQAFEIRDALNYYGSPVAKGVYAVGQSINIPMMGLTRASMVAESEISPQYRPLHTAPEFGAFVIVPGTVGSVPSDPPPVDPPVPPPANDVARILLSLDELKTLLTQRGVTCSIASVGSPYSNGDQRLTVRCTGSKFSSGQVIEVRP